MDTEIFTSFPTPPHPSYTFNAVHSTETQTKLCQARPIISEGSCQKSFSTYCTETLVRAVSQMLYKLLYIINPFLQVPWRIFALEASTVHEK